MPDKAVVAYVPALHAGYRAFFAAHKGSDLYILDTSFVALTPRMERDIRALTPSDAVCVVQALALFRSVSLLEKDSAKKLLSEHRNFVLPDEDVSRNFAKVFLKRKKVTFENVFLRWDKIISTTEHIIPPDRTISTKSSDLAHIRAAFVEARRSPDWWRQIGAVAVRGKKTLFRAYNRHFPNDGTADMMGDPRSNFDYGEQPGIYLSIHAEADIIAQAANTGISLKGADLFTTTFPCPNCARLLVRAGIQRVYYTHGYSSLDAEQILKSEGVELVLVKTK